MLRHVDVTAGGRADHRVLEPDHARQRRRKNPAAGQELKVFQETTDTGQARNQAEASFVLFNPYTWLLTWPILAAQFKISI